MTGRHSNVNSKRRLQNSATRRRRFAPPGLLGALVRP